jgi:Flp pilus assembly protein TadG
MLRPKRRRACPGRDARVGMKSGGLRALRRRLGRLTRACEGSVAPIVAVAMVPTIVALGVGVDLSRAINSRTSLQDAVDATALALAHMPPDTPLDTLQAKGQAWLAANLTDGSIGPVTLTLTPSTGELEVSAASAVSTTLTGITGRNQIPIHASSKVKWGLGHVEVALVLDNTGSMAGTKLQRLKDAATDLVDTLASTNGGSDANALKISLVPFSMTVRLSSDKTTLADFANADWMTGVAPAAYLPDGKDSDIFWQPNTDRFDMFDDMKVKWAGCVESRPQPYDVQDTAPNGAVGGTLFMPFFAPDEPDDDTIPSGTSTKWVHGKKQDVTTYYEFQNDYLDDQLGSGVTDWKHRQGHKAKYDQAPSRGSGPNAGCTMQPILRLTTKTQSVKNSIKKMQATGNTNVPLGLMWGWHSLSPSLPFADGAAYDSADTKKIVVLLTDGDNVNSGADNPNNSTYSGLGYIWQKRLGDKIDESSSDSERTKAMDARLTKLCDNMKAAKITIYTVRIDMAGTSAPTALAGCASSPDKFFDIDSSGLSKAFQSIAGSIGDLRIAE